MEIRSQPIHESVNAIGSVRNLNKSVKTLHKKPDSVTQSARQTFRKIYTPSKARYIKGKSWLGDEIQSVTRFTEDEFVGGRADSVTRCAQVGQILKKHFLGYDENEFPPTVRALRKQKRVGIGDPVTQCQNPKRVRTQAYEQSEHLSEIRCRRAW